MRHATWPHSLAFTTQRTLLSVLLATIAANSYAYTIPGPGDRITNIASGDFVDAQGNTQVINSNPVELTVTEVRALQLVRNQEQLGLIGGQISYPHTLTNTGNVSDTYQLSVSQNAGDNFDLNGLAVYADRNQDGVPDDNINLLVVGNRVSLEAGESLSVVATGSIPTNRVNNDTAIFSLTATSVILATLSASVTDTTKVTTGGVINVLKSQSISVGPRGSVITYTLTYTNSGNAAAEVRIQDTLKESELNYIVGSGRFSNGSGALTEASGESASNSAVDYQMADTGAQKEINIIIASVPAQSTGSISFQVEVLGADDQTIDNTAPYGQYNAGSLVKTASTNTVVFNITPIVGVVTNNTSASAANVGNPSSDPDNLLVLPAASAGSETLFTNYVWNTGDSLDTYNLSTVTGNLPSCATVRLYDTDGRTLLTDSNGDGVVDTGPVAAGASRTVVVGISSTLSCISANPINVDLTATSSNNATISDPVRNQLTAITQGTTDLYNSDNSGKQPQGVDNNGAAFITKPIQPAGKTVFPLIVNNISPQINNYNFITDDDGTLDPTKDQNDLPAGWSVEYFAAATPDCSTLGAKISNSGPVAANGTMRYCAVVSAPANALPGDLPLWFAVRSPINGQSDLVKDAVTVQTRRLLTLTPDNQGQVDIGGTIVYSHVLTNQGNVKEGLTVGDLTLTLNQTNANGFNNTLYFDANNNGTLDATDPQASDVAGLGVTNGAIGLDIGESIRLLVKVESPQSATSGQSSSVIVVATPTNTINGLTIAPVRNTDLTLVAEGQVRLVKEQALDADCNGVADTGYSLNPVQIKPAQCVFYKITATNQGSEPVSNVIISDTVPAYTTLQVPPAPSVSAGTIVSGSAQTNGATGKIHGNVGTLAPGSSQNLQFSIRIQPQ